MRRFFILSFALALTIAPLTAQTGSDVPRLANGKPNFNGVWQSLSTAHYDIERHMARSAMAVRKGPHGPVPAKPVLALGAVGSVPGGMGIVEGGKIPYRPDALAKRDENRANWLDRDPEIKCYLPGVPRATYMPYPFQIFHSDSSFFIAYEYAGAVRDIYLKNAGEAQLDSWMGHSAGHWDGDTFVAVVTGLSDSSWFDRSGNHHSDQIKVTERYTMMGPNHIQYEALIEDPVVLTEPFTIKLPLYRRLEDNAQIMDFKCVEFVEELMYGAYRRKPLAD